MIINLHRYRFIIIALLLLALIFGVYRYYFEKNKENPQAELEEQLFYGEFLTWNQVNKLFPQNAKVEVSDIETGMQFQVQRRGGMCHADVQPLTAEDTAVMKNIYNGKWTWKRRAVIVQLENGRKIAGSMNGMPHGLGNIEGNNFNGHFCIHFRDSKTHCSRKVDAAHQLMIWKSANILSQQLQSLDSHKTVEMFIAALDQGQNDIIVEMMDYGKNNSLLLIKLASIEKIKTARIYKVDENTFIVDVRIVFKDSSQEFYKSVQINTIKRECGWQIDPLSIMPLLDKKTFSESCKVKHYSAFEEDVEIDL